MCRRVVVLRLTRGILLEACWTCWKPGLDRDQIVVTWTRVANREAILQTLGLGDDAGAWRVLT